MKEHICFSGGATGADTVFGDCAEAAGHKVVHYTFDGHRKIGKNAFKLNMFQLLQADSYLIEANKLLRRKFPTKNPGTDNLLRRNYYQIHDTKRVYAVTDLDETGFPLGGTAWAVIMAMQLDDQPEIFFFSQKQNSWYKFVKITEKGLRKNLLIIWKKIQKPPRPSDKYTGIGTSKNLTENGIDAIKQLYNGN